MMQHDDVVDLSVGELLALDPERMWQTALSRIYGVSSPTKARYYAQKAQDLNLSIDEQIYAMMNLLPLTAVVDDQRSSYQDLAEIEKVLALIMDPKPLDKVSRLARSHRNDSIGSRFLSFENWKGFRNLETLGKEYLNPHEVPSVPPEAVEAAFLDNKRLIIAHVDGVGLFVGSDVTYKGLADKGGLQLLPSGLAFCGPRADLKAGNYVLHIDIRCDDPSAQLHFDVVANEGLNKLLTFNVIGSLSGAVAFEVKEQHRMIEVRCANASNRGVVCDIRQVAFVAQIDRREVDLEGRCGR
jgi:hypothetical protein